MKTVLYAPEAKKFIRKLDDPIKRRFKSKIESLAAGKIKGIFLHKPLANYQKIRVGSYRILFQEKEKDTIYIVHVEHRSKVYR